MQSPKSKALKSAKVKIYKLGKAEIRLRLLKKIPLLPTNKRAGSKWE